MANQRIVAGERVYLIPLDLMGEKVYRAERVSDHYRLLATFPHRTWGDPTQPSLGRSYISKDDNKAAVKAEIEAMGLVVVEPK